jgi:uncharacterized protein YoxC
MIFYFSKGGVPLDWIGWGFLVLGAVVTFFLVWTLILVSRTVRKLNTLLDGLEKEITPMMRSLRETSENLNCLLGQTQERLKQVEGLFQTLRESAQIFSLLNRIIRGGITPSLTNMAGLAVGLKTAGKILFKRKEKGGK